MCLKQNDTEYLLYLNARTSSLEMNKEFGFLFFFFVLNLDLENCQPKGNYCVAIIEI